MKCERDTAIRTVASLAALAAEQRRGKTTPIQKQNGLFSFGDPRRDRVPQFFRQNRSALAPRFLAQIDHADERHLAVVDALGKSRELVLFRERVMITLQRRGRAAEQHDGLFHFGAHHRDIARMITRRFLLFVGSLVLLIDDDQPEIFQRREHGAAGANDDASAAGMNLVPFIMAFAFG